MKTMRDLKRCVERTLLLFLALASPQLLGSGLESKKSVSDITNIGFMKNPPKALKEKFPMCDAFLKVEWIDKAKKIGYTHYEAMLINDKGMLDREIKTVWALVYLDDLWPSYTLDVYQYKRQGRMKELFDLVRNGEPVRVPNNFAIKYKGKFTVFYDPLGPVLSDYRQTVCIAYPDGQRVWIIEGKSVKHAYSEAQQESLSNRIKETGKSFSRQLLEKFWVMDVNFDGKDDYVFLGALGFGVIEYSWIDKLYQVDRPVDDFDYILTFPPNNRTCRLRIDGVFPLTTDGKNYYISNQCNLTKLTSHSEKE